MHRDECSLLATLWVLPQTPGLRVRWGSGAPVSPCASKFWDLGDVENGKGSGEARGEHVLFGHTSKSLRKV